MTAKGSRKRAAPGLSPVQQNETPANFITQPTQTLPDQFSRWDTGNRALDLTNYNSLSTTYTPNMYASLANQGVSHEPSNQLTRRPMNTIMQKPSYNQTGPDGWPDFIEDTQQGNLNWAQPSDEERLDEEAQEAMDTAKKARKQIPPFVRKLRSFLDERRNPELIHWSSSGDTFVVVEEEEFARTLIPELFKHANYASFVRQLNMYGFHKQVGLSDNSMRASERKNKSPSEYKNPYFKHGKPNWMWLIQKPKTTGSKSKAGRGRNEEAGEDEEVLDAEPTSSGGGAREEQTSSAKAPRSPLMISHADNHFAQEELTALHQELRTIRQQHQAIAGVIQKIRRDHDQMFHQAQAFQDLHTRHENSINAILTFLATVYNRSLEGHGSQNIGNMFAGSIPHEMPQHGSVVDVGDLGSQTISSDDRQTKRPIRRQPLLLQAPPPNDATGDGNSPSTMSSTRPSPNSVPPTSTSTAQEHSQGPGHSFIEELPEAETPQVYGDAPLPTDASRDASTAVHLPERDILSLINSTNASDLTNSAINQMDFGEALSHLQNRDGKGPLSASERNGMLQLMANKSNQGMASSDDIPNNSSNNALTSPAPPATSVPTFDDWQASNDNIAFLQKSMQDTHSKLANITNRLSPISPNGSIPGFDENSSYMGVSQNDALDFEQIFDPNAFLNDPNTSNNDFGNETPIFDVDADFGFDNSLGSNTSAAINNSSDQKQPDHFIKAVNHSSEALSPATTAEEVLQDDQEPPRKKRQRG